MIGCTVSTIGGIRQGITRAAEYGYDCTQIYTTASRRWNVSCVPEMIANDICNHASVNKVLLVSHIPFLVNLASPNAELRNKSVERMRIEIINAGLYGINQLVLHPGKAVDNSINFYETAFDYITEGLNLLSDLCVQHNVIILLETMSGQGTELGINFEELKHIIYKVNNPDVLGVCFDTAHVFASGYDISSVRNFSAVIQEFDECLGPNKLGCFHLNNTKIPCGKRVDRHSSIFDGNIALEVFEEIVNNPRFSKIPKIVEIPANDDVGVGYLQARYLKALKEGTNMLVDSTTEQYFNKNVKQVFVYLTNKCQLRCRQCLYKPLLDNQAEDLELDVLIRLLKIFKKYGAFKLSFLGGEPTLYKDGNSGADFSKVVEISKGLGYSYIRVDTNGQFESILLEDNNLQKLDEITFSLDGYDATTHDSMRGNGSFNKCISNIKHAVELGYNVQLTSCFHNGLCKDVNSGVDCILRLISLCEELGVRRLNLHPILKVGISRDQWIDNTEINPQLWIDIYNSVQERLGSLTESVEVRLPMRYIEKDKLDASHNYCPLKMGERALIMPDGTIKVCAFHIGTPYCVANYTSDGISCEKRYNEMLKVKSSQSTCCNQSSPDGLSALCMSYKPMQKEIVWNSIFA